MGLAAALGDVMACRCHRRENLTTSYSAGAVVRADADRRMDALWSSAAEAVMKRERTKPFHRPDWLCEDRRAIERG
jgi:hypothetical protein